MKHMRSIVTFAAIAVPGVLVATTSFLTPLTPGTLDRSPEQVRMPTADTRVICPGPLLTDDEAEGTDAEFVDDSNVSTRVVSASAPISAADGSVSAARLQVADLGGSANFDNPNSDGFISGDDPIDQTKLITGFARPGAPALTTGVETVEGTSGDLTGLATLTCGAAASNFRILAGSGAAGSNSQLLLSNPGDVPVQAEVALMTPSGQRGEPTEVSIKAGKQRAIRLGGLAGGAESLAVDVKVDGGVVSGSLQETVLDGLTPKGIDLATSGADADSQQVVTGLNGKDARLRVANPSDDLAEVSLKAYGPDGEIDIPPFIHDRGRAWSRRGGSRRSGGHQRHPRLGPEHSGQRIHRPGRGEGQRGLRKRQRHRHPRRLADHGPSAHGHRKALPLTGPGAGAGQRHAR